ncbi:unnamed protein product [Brassicogethes aeneus]|uniref:DUF4806 domain-containing protein n=1 Tax=Brassicogethes aeneus TaxID=1431903 RepID=A0A9P0APT8_BRAAE|nr:unnamed protein product [Brassicogethes aeneus]
MSCLVERDKLRTLELAKIELQHLENWDKHNTSTLNKKGNPALEGNSFKSPLEIPRNFCKTGANCDKILSNQDIIISNQEQILNQVSGFNVTLEELINRYYKIEKRLEAQTAPLVPYTNVLSQSNDFEPVNSEEDINFLEEQLKDELYMNALVEKLSIICGRTGKEHGFNACYTLVDNLFTRHFMTLCSWAGGSRNEVNKISFKTYKNTIKLFFKIILLADYTFTHENLQQFFKSVLKNATRRNAVAENARTSRSKKRPKKLVYHLKRGERGSDVDIQLNTDIGNFEGQVSVNYEDFNIDVLNNKNFPTEN